MIPQSFIQELLNRIDLVELVNKVVPLKKTGKNFQACCPFHNEKTPSFNVNPQKQFFKCFGCGASGTAIGFVMQYEGLNFPEAVKRLADQVGMQVPAEDPKTAEREARARTLTDRMQLAADFYKESLKTSQRAQDYLKGRGISGATASRYGLGYAPDDFHGLRNVFGSQYDDAEMEEKDGCGLVVINDKGYRYDRYRGRVIFPIRNRRGQVISFGARTMVPDEVPKYINGPETVIYHKGLEIYGLFEAYDAIRKKGRAIVCEGYMDVIQLAQAGFEEAVAALGTSITPDHVHKLLKTTDKIYFSFDGDGAGQKALRRALIAALPVVGDSQEVRFVVLPPEHDPDSLIKARGPDAFEAEIEKSLPLTQFFVKTVSEGKDLSTGEGRSQFLAEAKPLVVSMRSAPLLRVQLLSELAMYARMTADELAQAFGIAAAKMPAAEGDGFITGRPDWKRRPGAWKGGARRTPAVIEPRIGVADMREKLLQYFVSYPSLTVEFGPRIAEEFTDGTDTVAQEIVEVWRTAAADEAHPVEQPQLLLEMLSSSPHAAHYRTLLTQEMVLETPLPAARQEIHMALCRLEIDRIKRRLQEIVTSPEPDLNQYSVLTLRMKAVQQSMTESAALYDRTSGTSAL